jgi:hypothetical protein
MGRAFFAKPIILAMIDESNYAQVLIPKINEDA